MVIWIAPVHLCLAIVTLENPFGDMSRSKPLIVIGVVIAAIGIVTCFIPDLKPNTHPPFICFAPGGFLLLLQMFLSQEKLRTWVKYGGIFKHLIVGCGVVYVLSILIGLLILVQSMLTTAMTAVVGLIFGVAIIYLALVLRKIYLTYPEAENTNPGTVELSTDKMMLLMTGVFMLLLGILLIPVNLVQLPFSGSAQWVANGHFCYPNAGIRQHPHWSFPPELVDDNIWTFICSTGNYIQYHSRSSGETLDTSYRNIKYFGWLHNFSENTITSAKKTTKVRWSSSTNLTEAICYSIHHGFSVDSIWIIYAGFSSPSRAGGWCGSICQRLCSYVFDVNSSDSG